MSLNRRSKVIVAIQIVGSVYATILLLADFPGFDIGWITWLFYNVSLAVPALGIASGLLYWAGKTAGFYGSIAAHALQIPMIFTTALAYKMAFGISVFLKVIGPTKLVELNFGVSTILVAVPGQQSAVVAANLYALFAMMYLIRDWKKTNEQNIQSAT